MRFLQTIFKRLNVVTLAIVMKLVASKIVQTLISLNIALFAAMLIDCC